jgi:excinuclease ABC subunit C
MKPEIFQELQSTLPTEPGIYKYYDKDKVLLYVGKAKNIKGSAHFT